VDMMGYICLVIESLTFGKFGVMSSFPVSIPSLFIITCLHAFIQINYVSMTFGEADK
jgi:hypothetical protein